MGLSLAVGDTHTAGGGLLLFVANISAISLAGGLVFLTLGIRPRRWGPETRRRLRRRMLASVFLLLVVAIPLAAIMNGIVQDAEVERLAWETLAAQVETEGDWVTALELERTDEGILVLATVQSAHTFDREALNGLADTLGKRLGQTVRLRMLVLPVVSSE